MNKLYALESLGIKINWKTIEIGMFGKEYIQPQINKDNMYDYLYSKLDIIDEWFDNIITLISESDNDYKVRHLIEVYANKEDSDYNIELRKWRVYLIKKILDGNYDDWLQKLLELMEFWVSVGLPEDCPQSFPKSGDIKGIEEYFTESNCNKIVKLTSLWVNKEMFFLQKI